MQSSIISLKNRLVIQLSFMKNLIAEILFLSTYRCNNNTIIKTFVIYISNPFQEIFSNNISHLEQFPGNFQHLHIQDPV